LRCPGRPLAHFKDAEVAKLDSTPLPQMLDERIQEDLDDIPDDRALLFRPIDDGVDQLLLRNVGHGGPPVGSVLSVAREWVTRTYQPIGDRKQHVSPMNQ